jgi:hypothetical protein
MRVRVELPLDPREEGVIAFGGKTALLALKNGRVRVYDATTLEVVREIDARDGATPRFAAASPDGRWFAVAFHDGHLWLYDAQQDAEVSADLLGQGAVSAVNFTANGNLLIADSWTRVTEYEPESWREVSRSQPARDNWERAYRYVIHPLYTVFPRPREMNLIVDDLLEDEDADTVQSADLSAPREEVRYWPPIRNNTIFILVVLALGCLYVSRKDF